MRIEFFTSKITIVHIELPFNIWVKINLIFQGRRLTWKCEVYTCAQRDTASITAITPSYHYSKPIVLSVASGWCQNSLVPHRMSQSLKVAIVKWNIWKNQIIYKSKLIIKTNFRDSLMQFDFAFSLRISRRKALSSNVSSKKCYCNNSQDLLGACPGPGTVVSIHVPHLIHCSTGA